ncbi:MAG: PQQ-dependent sugar dehydrogenase [Solirubrobacterales bacterium]
MLASAAPASALTLQPIAPPGTFDDPTYVTSDPSNPDRLFVTEQGGRLRLVEGGAVSTVLDLDESGLLCGPCGLEEGLLSVALPADFPSSGRLYVYYTNSAGNNEIDEFTLGAGEPTRRVVLPIPHPDQTNHNGGQLQFGPDGMLYVGTGDGGGQHDPEENAQNLDVLLGKLLRIDPLPSGGAEYTVPNSNPFVDVDGRDEIWSYGLRNPWRFSFDALTGDLLIGDVGQDTWEEVNFDPAPNSGRGRDFGWDCREGLAFHENHAACDGQYTDPIHQYSGGAAITGGYVVRDGGLGDLFGRYLYADYYEGEIRSLVPALPSASGDRSEGVGVGGLSSFGQDSACRLYVASQEEDTVYRLVGDQPSACATAPGGSGGNPPRCRGKTATIVASPGVEVTGTGGRDVVVGTGRADEIRTGPGRDIVCSRGGADDVRTGGGKDFAKGGGADDLRGGGKKDDLRGGGGNDELRGGGGADDLRGGGGNDELRGGGGKDRLRGGGGKDRLKGGPGRDRCKGGPGRDRERSC